MALIAVMALFAVSCGDDNSNNNDGDKTPCTIHIDSNGDGKCDSCGVTVENNNDNNDNGNDDGTTEKETDDYTLIVKDQSGAPVSGIKVAIVIKGTTPDRYYTTDATGKVTVSVEKTMRRVIAVFDTDTVGYLLPSEKECNFDLDSTTLTVTLTKLTAYTVRVLDANGDPVANAEVQLCYGETCLTKQTTDENGEYVAYINYTGTPKVIVFAISNEYIYFDEGETTLVVTIPEA